MNTGKRRFIRVQEEIMAQVFGRYAYFYDSLYYDKDYIAECDYLCRLFKKHSDIKVKTILDLGCGTGGHALILSRLNYKVTGLDRSMAMLNLARAKSKEARAAIDFHKRDIRKFDLKKRYDAVISMFAVMGYQTRTEDFLNALKCGRRHLKPGGIFMFDVWFGPAVLNQKPGERTKVVNSAGYKIIRQTHSKLYLGHNIVKVKFDVRRICGNSVVERSREEHMMRFFFMPEIDYLAKSAGFKTNIYYVFLTERQDITEKDWNLCVVLK